ncbi:hypothetical protein AVEN_118962-1, partial [Araneus ventricosus]
AFGSDVQIVPTSMEEKRGSRIGQYRGCRSGDPTSLIPGDECVPLCPLLRGVLHCHTRTKPLNSRALVGPYRPIIFPALKSALSDITSERAHQTGVKAVKNFLQSLDTDFYQDGFSKLISGTTNVSMSVANTWKNTKSLYFVMPLYISVCNKASL